jgi:hypothetical protein
LAKDKNSKQKPQKAQAFKDVEHCSRWFLNLDTTILEISNVHKILNNM